MGTIRVSNIRVRANHGCMDEEARIGGDYLVHVELTADLVPSMVSDDLNDTYDYGVLAQRAPWGRGGGAPGWGGLF